MEKDCRASVCFDRKEARFVGLEGIPLEQLRKSFPTINIESELEKMTVWLLHSPKGKRRKGNINFIMNWLNNASVSSSPHKTEEKQEVKNDLSLPTLFDQYLSDLWKGKEYILELNKRKS